MRPIVGGLIAAFAFMGHASLASAQRLVLTRTFTNPAPIGGDLFSPHQFGTSVGWLDSQVLVGAPGVDFGQSGQPQFIADHGMIYLFDTGTGALLRSVSVSTASASTIVQQAGFSVAGVGGQMPRSIVSQSLLLQEVARCGGSSQWCRAPRCWR